MHLMRTHPYLRDMASFFSSASTCFLSAASPGGTGPPREEEGGPAAVPPPRDAEEVGTPADAVAEAWSSCERASWTWRGRKGRDDAEVRGSRFRSG